MSFSYMITIYPLELVYKYIYLACVSVVGSYGVGLMVMSLVTFVIFVPLKKWAKKAAGKERDIQDVLAPQIAKIQSESTGAERQERISKLYKRYGYHPVMAIRSAIGAGLQIPFLMAAYYMISGLKVLEGQSFLFVKNLSRPDGLLFGLNLLPIVMTLINFATTFTTKDMRKKDRIQAIIIALLFLALLYSAPSALLIYWTCNNILYLAENIKPVKAFTDKMYAFMCRSFAAGSKVLRKTVQKLKQKDIALACCFGLVCGLFFFVFIPMNTFWHNVNEFGWKPSRLVRALLPYAITVSLIMAMAASFALKIKKAAADGVSVFHVFVLSVMIAFLVEGTLMGYGLKQLNGQENLFASKGRMIFDSLVWIAIIGAMTYFRRPVARHFAKALALFAVFCSATLVDTYLHREEKVMGDTVQGASDKLKLFTKEEVLSKLQYGDNDNILIVMPDALDTMSLEKTLDENPSFKETLKGFYLFQENLGAGGQTKLALPQILSGKTYTGRNYRDFVQKALFGEDSLPMRSVKSGRKTFIEAAYWHLLGGGAQEGAATKTKDKKKVSFSLKDKVSFVFRFVPYAVKGKLEDIVNYKTGVTDNRLFKSNAAVTDNLNRPIFEAMIKRMPFKTKAPVTQFIHMVGAHPPYKDRISFVKQWLMLFDDYLKALKANGLYDKSTIVVIADHGDYTDHRDYYPERKGAFGTFHFPAFLIKMPSSDGDLTIRKDLMSTVYLTDLLNTFYKKGQSVAVLNDYLSKLPRNRAHFINQAEKDLEADTKYLAFGDFRTLSLKKDQDKPASELKPLKENVVYTFKAEDEQYPYPDWNGKNLGRFGGYGADFWRNKSELSLRGDVKGKTKKRFTFEMRIAQGDEFKIKMTDENTKKSVIVSEKTLGFQYVTIDAVSDKNGVFNFSFEKLASYQGGLIGVRYGEIDTFETGREYKMSKDQRPFGALYTGWHAPEKNGSWSTGKLAKARFKLKPVPKKDLKVTMAVSFLHYPNTNNFLKIATPDGETLFERKFDDGVGYAVVDFTYPARSVTKDGIVYLTIESNANQHNVLNPNAGDARILGMFFARIRFDETTP